MQNDSDNGYPRTGKEARLVSDTGAAREKGTNTVSDKPYPSVAIYGIR